MDVMSVIQWLQHHSILWMFAVFLLLVVTTFWPGRQPRFERDGHIPLEDDR
ncbi:MAG: cbb3-type cytochrome c oxidase subunit 3 [Acetobacteraceae bacterium]|nr:cbb3-type cytochrome c oxidase subunit 3 [Acetobacteraceae bacterium]